MVIVEGGNTFDQITGSFAVQGAGETVTQLNSSAPVTTPGQTVTYTATVTTGGVPEDNGSVEFFDATTKTYLGTSGLSNGTAALAVTLNQRLTVGDTIVATYLPTTGALAPSSGQITQAVLAATTTTLSGPSSTPVYGEQVSFTFTVTDTTPSGGTPTGTVEFYDGSTDLGPGTVLSGSGSTVTSSFNTSKLTAGTHNITAVYTPSGPFQTGTDTLKLLVDKDATTTDSTSTLFSNFGQTVTLTAVITANSPGGGTPTGTVRFVDVTTGNTLGSGTLSGGVATLRVSVLEFGVHTIQAIYGGDGNFTGSSSRQNTRVTVGGALYVLSPWATGALDVSGATSLTEPGPIYVDSDAKSAVTARGDAVVTATSIHVVGSVNISGAASLHPKPITGVQPVPDPLAELGAPPPGPAQRFVNLSRSSVLTINPGVYSSITVGGDAHLIMNPGIYEIAGGGFTVTDSGKVTGSGVLIYNERSCVPLARPVDGAVNISRAASVQLTAPTSGTYAGIVLFQAPNDPQTISIGGSAVATFGGTVYASAATVSVTGVPSLCKMTLVVNELMLQGSASITGRCVGIGRGRSHCFAPDDWHRGRPGVGCGWAYTCNHRAVAGQSRH